VRTELNEEVQGGGEKVQKRGERGVTEGKNRKEGKFAVLFLSDTKQVVSVEQGGGLPGFWVLGTPVGVGR